MLIRELLLERFEDRMETLSQWWNDPTIYVSFTELEKLGINPQSHYNTPLGIYAYPLKEMYENIDRDRIPFAGENPWIQVLKSTQATELSTYSDGDLKTDIAKLKQLFGSQIKLSREAKSIIKHGFFDTEDEYLTKDLYINDRSPADMAQSRERLVQQMNQDGRAFDFMVKLWSENAKIDNRPSNHPATKFWNITRNIALEVTEHRPIHRYPSKDIMKPDIKMVKPATLMWNKIFRLLGYVAFSDKTGMGLIHTAEPISSVFLTPSSYTHIATVRNIQKSRTPSRSYTRLNQITYALERAESDIKYHRSGRHVRIESGIDPATAHEFRNHVLSEWEKLLTYGDTKYIELTGLKWKEHEAEDFPKFMKALLSTDFNQLPAIASFLDDKRFYFGASYEDATKIANDFVFLQPPKKGIKTYIDVMLGTHVLDEAAFVLGSADDNEDEIKKSIGTRITMNILNSTGIKIDQLKSYLGYKYYYRLTKYIPEDLLNHFKNY